MQRHLSLLKLIPRKACTGISAHVENNDAPHKLLVRFFREKKSALHNGLVTEDNQPGMLKGKICYGADMIFPFFALPVDRSFGLQAHCEKNEMTLQYTDITTRERVDCWSVYWSEWTLLALWSETEGHNRVVHKVYALHCLFGFFALLFHLVGHLLDELEWLESISFTEARLFEHFSALVKQLYTTASRAMFTRMEDIMQNMGSAMHDTPSPENRVSGNIVGAAAMRERQRLKKRRKISVENHDLLATVRDVQSYWEQRRSFLPFFRYKCQ